MILQPFGPWRSNDSWLWHLSLSVCLEGGRALWEGVRRKREQKEHHGFFTRHIELNIFVTFFFFSFFGHSSWMVIPPFIHVLWFHCYYEVALRWSFFKYNTVKGSVDSEPQHHQSWLAWGGIRSFIKMTRLTFQILSFFCDIWLFILLCSSCTRVFKVLCVLRDSLEIDIYHLAK